MHGVSRRDGDWPRYQKSLMTPAIPHTRNGCAESMRCGLTGRSSRCAVVDVDNIAAEPGRVSVRAYSFVMSDRPDVSTQYLADVRSSIDAIEVKRLSLIREVRHRGGPERTP